MAFTFTLRAALMPLLGTALLTACSVPAPTAVGPASAAPARLAAVRLPLTPPFGIRPAQAAPVAADTSARGLAGVLADVRRRSYFLNPVASGAATRAAANVAQHLTARLGATAYTVVAATPVPAAARPGAPAAHATVAAPAWQVRFTLRGIGRGGRVAFRPQPHAAATATDTTISYAHGAAFTVDYLNSSAGVRQNYHLARRPAGSAGPVQVLLALDTKLRVRAEGNEALRFATAAGPVLRYADLRAWDAAGHTLPAHLALQKGGHALALVVDDAQATYPITIDPLASTPSSTLTDPAATPNDNFGWSVAGAGDVNGDGYADVLVGAYGTSDNQGRAYLYLGSSTGLGSAPAATLSSPAATAGDRFGWSVAGAGDVNGDGYADVLVGARGTSSFQGRAYCYLGSRTGISSVPSVTLTDPAATSFDSFGWSVAGAGDVNGDGYADVLVGASGTTTTQGKTYLYLGNNAGLRPTPSTSLADPTAANYDAFGISVAGAGDVNGDGYADVLIGANGVTSGRGQAYLYLGDNTGLNSTPSTTLTDPTRTDYDNFGTSVAGAGDVNGDGYADVVVGAPGTSNTQGLAYLYLGSKDGLDPAKNQALTDLTTVGYFGYSVAGAGDVNGDGYADVLVGAYGTNTYQGRTALFLGSSTGPKPTPSASFTDPAATNYDSFGISVAGAGDVNGDGYADVLTGANGTSTSRGTTYLQLGSAGTLLTSASATFNEPTPANNDQFGWRAVGAGDVNGDGYADVLISAQGASNRQGKVYLYLGSSAGLRSTPAVALNDPTARSEDRFGASVAGAGDVNGDGYADVLIGAYGGDIRQGAAYLYLGSSMGLSATPSLTLNASLSNSSDYFGASVAGAGDVNGDGYADVLIGEYGFSGSFYFRNRGIAYLYLGSRSGLSTTPTILGEPGGTPENNFGYSLAGAGDVNGDGYADVLIGATGTNGFGQAYLYLGRSTGLNASPDATFFAPIPAASSTGFGWSVAGAGDVNGDGYADILIGDRGGIYYHGHASLYLGRSTGVNTTPNTILTDPAATTNYNAFSASITGAGDVNGDGYADVLVGAAGANTEASTNNGRGATYLYLGGSTGLPSTPSATFADPAASNGDHFGGSVAGAGDVNGDGDSDVLIGAYGTTNNQGRTYLYLGNEGGGRVGRLRLYNPDLTTLLSQSTLSANQFGIGLVARSAFGRVWARLVWEAVANGSSFSNGSSLSTSTAYSGVGAWTNVAAGGLTELKSLVAKAGHTTRVRARLEYATASPLAPTTPHNGTGGVGALPRYGPWTYLDAQQLGQSTNTATPLPVRGLAATTSLQLQAYPNPSQQQVTVRIEAEQAGAATLRLTDMLGRVVLQRQLTLARGRTTLALAEASRLSPGLYLLQLQQGAQQQSFSLVRQ